MTTMAGSRYLEMKQDPCWDGYEAIGMKEKNGKTVPNCVPKGAASAKNKAQKFQESQK